MHKFNSILIIALNILQLGCSERHHQPTPTPSENTVDLKLHAAISDCKDLIINEEERKTAEAIASNWKLNPSCENLVPKLAKATYVSLMHQGINSIGILKYARSLQILYLGFNKISDITPLRDHPTLFVLDLQFNVVSDVGGLGSMPKLEILSLNDNRIANLEAIGKFPDLSTLIARNNDISSVLVLVDNMPTLAELALTGNPLGTTIERSEQNCPKGDAVPVGISQFCSSESL